MIGKLCIFSALLVSLVAGQDVALFLSKIKAERGFEDNPCAGRSGAHFAVNPRGCSWYFACTNDNTVDREDRCPTGLHFNYLEQTCDFKINVKCELDDRWNNLVCPSTRGVSIIPHPYSCSKYTVCFDGIQNDRDCPPGLHFSYFDNDCVAPFLADCSLDYHLCQKSIETGLPVFIPNSRDCRSYFLCLGETSVPLTCAPGQHFIPELNWCDAPEEANCRPAIPDDLPRIPEKVFIDCEGESNLSIAHPDSCSFFFFCAGDRSYLQVCGGKLIFDVLTNRCQIRDDGLCILDVPTEAPTTEAPTTEAPTTEPDATEDPTTEAPATEAPEGRGPDRLNVRF